MEIKDSLLQYTNDKRYDFNKTITLHSYGKMIEEEYNIRLQNLDEPLEIEHDGEKILLVNPRLAYNPNSSDPKILSFSLSGTIVNV